ncbi:hypothetical protein [Streptomyces lienomycini]|uniref:Uncharacterized protein n=1 Tax=Streptomyces lienomycini TaxID=284035 RepID=A0ABV9X5U0_9ACTN|nr:hypothetical protein [Streptomyces lienomycini]
MLLGVSFSDATPKAEQVQDRWRVREAPAGDFILYADGSLSVMNLLQLHQPGRRHDLRAQDWHWSELLRATAWTASDWMDVDVTLASCAHAGSRALAGESPDHGSIGWVALTRDGDEGTLEWVAVSCNSDPFAEVTLDATTVTATSTSGRIWAFPRNTPHQVEITSDPGFPWRQVD